ncbi:MAG TPA: hypothetical protein VFP81_07925 [Propionibacteriaceae bacterium]|nr:hypothetical protein [Propionibacteriaceae bacterium]
MGCIAGTVIVHGSTTFGMGTLEAVPSISATAETQKLSVPFTWTETVHVCPGDGQESVLDTIWSASAVYASVTFSVPAEVVLAVAHFWPASIEST